MIVQRQQMLFLWLVILNSNGVIKAGEKSSFDYFSHEANNYKKNTTQNFFVGSSSLLGQHCHKEGTDLCYGLAVLASDKNNKNIAENLAHKIAYEAKIPADIRSKESKKLLDECFSRK